MNTDKELINALKLIQSINPKEINLPKYSNYFANIAKNFEIARTAEYVENTRNIPRDKAFEIAEEVQNELDFCDEYNAYEGEFIDSVIAKRKEKEY